MEFERFIVCRSKFLKDDGKGIVINSCVVEF